MLTFKPNLVIFRKNALDYPLGEKLYNTFQNNTIETEIVSSKGPFPLNYDLPFKKKFHRSKKIIIVSVRSLSKFQSCKPSAHYQLPLVSGCPGQCHYCYLSTNLGKNPYIKIYVNIKAIFNKVEKYVKKQQPEIIIFEGAATSDPLPVEKWTNSLAYAIKFFANNKYARFRFVTKYTEVEPLLKLKHNQKTEFRFSLNSEYSIKKFETNTPSIDERLQAAVKVKQANYPLGFLIAPIFIYENWKDEYQNLIQKMKNYLKTDGQKIFFELITHRYTERAKKIIKKAYPNTELPMENENRRFKYGQFGYGKYIYPPDIMTEIENYLTTTINHYFPETEIKYFV